MNPASNSRQALHAGSLWDQIYQRVPLCDVPRHFAGIRQSPYMTEYLTTVLQLAPRSSRSLETGVGSGYGAVWLSHRGVQAEGIDIAPAIVERARQVNSVLGGSATFRYGDLFGLYQDRKDGPHYSVIHHQGVLEHFPVPWIQAALAQQVAIADWVVFSVPSVYYPYEPEAGDERLLPLEEWQHILAPFDIEELRYHGDPRFDHREHVLGILRGQKATPDLIRRMSVPAEPYPAGITAIVHTRNEERHIAECIASLQGWTDEIIVCDMESTDETVAIAERLIGAENIVRHPYIQNFDRARNVSAMRARRRWVFYLDADERVPPGLGMRIREMVAEEPGRESPAFDAVLFPFRHHFAGHWLQSLYPGYTAPRLFRNGRFRFNARLHCGAEVDGQTILFPANDPNLAIVHFSYDSYAHYLEKLNRYTDGEARNLLQDGRPFHWREAIRTFVQDYQQYERRGMPQVDGVPGWIYTFHSAFYRFEQYAKLYELKQRNGQVRPEELAVPESVEEMLEYALAVARHRPIPPPAEIRVSQERPADPHRRDILWCAPLHDPSGYGEESRQYVAALDTALDRQSPLQRQSPAVVGARSAVNNLAVQSIPWSYSHADLRPAEDDLLKRLAEREVVPGFIQVIHDFPPSMKTRRHPQAGLAIAHTVFETDRLPADWVQALNDMDYVWVLSEFNRKTFADAGVDPEKLVVVPAAIDPAPYRELPAPSARVADILSHAAAEGTQRPFTFLSVFDWTLHKGWDVLLRAFLEEFPSDPEVQLLLKVWSTMNYSASQIEEQAAAYVRETLGRDLAADTRIRFVHDHLTRDELTDLFAGCDCYCMPSRGEGWGRPYMEALACGKPVIATNWSGQTAYLTDDNCFLVDCDVVPIPERGWREVPTYRGHCWAEPRVEHLRARMRYICENPEEAQRIGLAGREDMFQRFNPETVGCQMLEELERAIAPKPVASASAVSPEPTTSAPISTTSGKVTIRDRRSKAKAPSTPPANNPVSVRWEGSFFVWHSLGHVNREIGLELLKSGEAGVPEVNLSIAHVEPYQFAPHTEHRFRELGERVFCTLDRPADVHVRHFYPPRFDPPEEGHLVIIQPWEYGFIPFHWKDPILTQVSEVWCYSQYVKNVYLASGIPEEKLKVTPLGVDTTVFHPGARPYVFTDEAGAARWNRIRERACEEMGAASDSESVGPQDGDSQPFVFMFAGGTLDRKGIDILLEAYTKAFSAFDDVCLVVKDTCTKTVYQGQNMQPRILELAQDESRPPIIYLDDDLSAHQLAGLYAASDCLVQPYRGEGFCLPALEAMACGKPVIVPEGGPTDDFVDETVGWRVRAQKKTGSVKIGPWFCVEPTWMFEVSPDDLARLMRKVYWDREEAKKRGAAAAERARANWTWNHSAAVIRERLRALQAAPPPHSTSHTSDGPVLHPHTTWPPSVTSAIDPAESMIGAQAVVYARPDEMCERLKTEAEKLKEELAAAGVADAVALQESPALAGPAVEPVPAKNSKHIRGDRAKERKAGKTQTGSARKSGTINESRRLRRVQPTISLCMIVKNEERCLKECLDSVMPFFDQVVVVDTGSTDRTVEIATACGAEVHHFAWCDSFSAARNESLRYATGDWCFWLDADDVIEEQYAARLREIVMYAEDRVGGFLVKLDFPPAPGHTGWTVVDHLKLFRNDPKHRFMFRLHEQLLDSIQRNGYIVEPADIRVVHKNYDHSPEGQRKKRERDMPLLLLDIEESPGHPFPWHNLGMTHFFDHNFAEAIPALKQSLVLSSPWESTVRKLYTMLAGSYEELRDLPNAKYWLEKGLELFAFDPDLVFRAGKIYHELGDLAASERSYLQLLNGYDQYQTDSYDVMITGPKAHHNLALLYLDQGRVREAEAHFSAAVAGSREFSPSYRGLYDIFEREQRFNEARAVVSKLAEIDPATAEELHRRLSALGQ